jgi:hypothetical protein
MSLEMNVRNAGNAETISNKVDFQSFDYSDENDEDAICGLRD